MVADSTIDNVVVAVLLAVALGACSSADGGTDESTVYFTPLERQETVVEPVEAPGPPVDLENRESYRQIVEGFRKSAAALFQREDIEKRLDQIERVFLGTGKYLELVSIYQDVYDRLGVDSPVADRLAWAYIRLGQRQQARALLDEMQRARPNDATVAFLDGFYWMNAGQDSPKAFARAVLQWRRVLDLAPNFEAFGRVSARSLKARIRQLERRLPKPPEQLVERPKTVVADGDGGGTDTESGTETSEDAPTPESEAEPADGKTAEASPSDEETDERTKKADAETPKDAPSTSGARASDESADDDQGPTPVGVVMMRADEALSKGNPTEAERRYEKILDRDPDHAGAQIGLVKVAWKQNPEDPKLADRVRKLADNQDLEARDVYDLGLFAKVRLKDQKLAEEIFERVREMNPEFAKKVGID